MTDEAAGQEHGAHMLSIPYIFYDTEPLESGCTKTLDIIKFFQTPMGQKNIREEPKSDLDTNMTMSARLPTPVDFEVHGIEMTFPGKHEIVSAVNIQSHSRLVFTKGRDGQVFLPADALVQPMVSPQRIGQDEDWGLELSITKHCFVKEGHKFVLYGRTYVQMRLLGTLHYPKGWYAARNHILDEWLGFVPRQYASGVDMQED